MKICKTINNIKVFAKQRNYTVRYKTVEVVPNFNGYTNILTQDMINEENVKYVLKYDFDLENATITVPLNCCLEFDGGSIKHGTIIGQNTFVNNVGGVDTIFGAGITQEGTWRYSSSSSDPKEGISREIADELYQPKDDYPTTTEVEQMISNIPKDVDDHLDATSVNPVQNKVVTEALNNTKKKVENAYDVIFAKHNLLNNPFFKSDEGWNVNGLGNGSIEDGKVSIVGKGNVSQEYSFVAKHVYMAVCFVKFNELFNITPENNGYYSKPGLGFRIRSNDTVLGAYRINIDNVSIEHVEDYVPVMFVFRNTVNCDATIYFGELYNTGGSVRGNIAHTGLYDITDIAKDATYEKLYFEYKEWIEDKLGLFNASNKVVYPDSIAKEAFVERMNDALLYFGLKHARYCNPSGLSSWGDNFNDGVTYKTVISPTSIREGAIININGSIIEVPNYNVYFYDVVGANTYIVTNLYTEDANRVSFLSYWEGNSFIGKDPCFRNQIKEYPGKPERTDYRDEFYVKVPVNATKMAIQSDVSYAPVVRCYSQTPIDNSSIEITTQHDDATESKVVWSAKENIVTCRDMAILAGIAGFNRKMQEALCPTEKTFAWHDSNGKGENVALRISIDNWKDWYVVMMKDGASERNEQGNYKKVRYSLLAKNKINGRCFAAAIIRNDVLPDYTGNPEKAAANQWGNLVLNMLNHANKVKNIEISTYVPVNGITVSNPEQPDYNTWIERDDYFVSSLIDVSDYVGGTAIIAKGERNCYYSFITDYPVAGKPIQYATGYTNYIVSSHTVNAIIPTDAKYLVMNIKEGDNSYAPDFVRLESSPFDFSDIDWDACCVGEMFGDVPFAVNEIDQEIPDVWISKSNKWFGNFRGKNINKAFQPFSTTKLLTSMIALEYLKCSDLLVLNESDFVWGSHSSYAYGEMLKVEDAINLLICISDNILCTALSRVAGYEILKGRKLYLIDKTVERYTENS